MTKKMTPCERLGYKMGDKFIVSNNKLKAFSRGTIVELYEDDGSSCPLFEGETFFGYSVCAGKGVAYAKLKHVTPLCTTSEAKNTQILNLEKEETMPNEFVQQTKFTENTRENGSLDAKLALIKELREHIEDIKADLQEHESTLQTLQKQVEESLQEYGFGSIEVETKKSPLIITDWHDLQKGDIIIAKGDTWNYIHRDKQVVVDQIECSGYTGNYPIFADGDWGLGFEFVIRP